jgi:hypothetical protein
MKSGKGAGKGGAELSIVKLSRPLAWPYLVPGRTPVGDWGGRSAKEQVSTVGDYRAGFGKV